MKRKPVIPRARADRAAQEAVDYYLREAGGRAALAFVDALERAFSHIGNRPATGSTRHAHELDLPVLRSWPVKRHPYLLFYVERDDHIDVWRILHDQRDIPAWLREGD